VDAARVAFSVIEQRIADRDGWFDGRELAEALRIRMSAAQGRNEEALHHFDSAVALAERSADSYNLASLVAFSASTIYPLSPDRIQSLISRYPQEMKVIGIDDLLRKSKENGAPRN
jgi:hypothetical protein